jgi:hypothetical protein
VDTHHAEIIPAVKETIFMLFHEIRRSYISIRGSDLYNDLHFLGEVNNYKFGNIIDLTNNGDNISMVSANTERYHRVVIDIADNNIKSGNYIILYISMGEAIMLVYEKEWPIVVKRNGFENYSSWDNIENHQYTKIMKLRIDDINDESGWVPYYEKEYDYYANIMIKLGLSIKFDHIKALRGKIWEIKYEDGKTPIVCKSGNRLAIIKPIRE